jgi:hypothetical protein
VKRLLYIALFIEVGFVLAVAPWSEYWDRNYFWQEASMTQAVLTNNFVRGGVTGLGLVNLFVGVCDLVAQVLPRTRRPQRAANSAVDET